MGFYRTQAALLDCEDTTTAQHIPVSADILKCLAHPPKQFLILRAHWRFQRFSRQSVRSTIPFKVPVLGLTELIIVKSWAPTTQMWSSSAHRLARYIVSIAVSGSLCMEALLNGGRAVSSGL